MSLKFLSQSVVIFVLFVVPALAENNQPQQETAALEKQVEALMDRVNELESKERQLTGLTEKEAVSTTDSLTLKISGLVNRAMLWHSNGKDSNTAHVDNDNSPTRLNFTGLGKLSEDMTVGATLEAALESNSTDNIDVHDTSGSKSTFNRRKAEVFIKHKIFGELYLGQGSTASDGTMENTDLSKTGVVSAGTSVGFMAGGTRFYDKSTQARGLVDAQALNVEKLFDGSDGLFRRDRIRYNTPNFAGFSLQGSHYYRGRNDNWDVALKYAGSIGGSKISAQTAYMHRNSLTKTVTVGTIPTKYSQFNASAGVLFENGISLFAGVVNRDWQLKKVHSGTVYHGKLGYQRDFFEAGKTAFAVDYGEYTNMVFDTRPSFEKDQFKGKTYGAFAVQFLDRIATELYLGVRLYKFKGPSQRAVHYKDVKAVMVGSRIKF